MKKSLLALTVAMSFGFAAAQTTAPTSAPQVPALTDVPAGHWAKDAIDRLVSRGIILGYPDGTFRGTQTLTRYEAAIIIARLLDQVRQGETPVPLNQEDITALQNAIQELAADLAALGVRVSDLEANAVGRDDFARLEARIEEVATASTANRGDEAAVQGLQTQIEELTARVDEYEALRNDIDEGASNIAALNDLTVLLNQDILDLQDRLSAAESAQADFVQRSDFDTLSATLNGQVAAIDTRLAAVDGRVGKLETAPKFGVSGSIDASFGRISRTEGTRDFDITRLTTGTPVAGVFDVKDSADVTVVDTAGYNYTDAGTGVRFGVNATNLATTNGAVVVRSAGINFNTTNPYDFATDPAVYVDSANASGELAGQKFTVAYNRRNSNFKFQDYLFSNGNNRNNRRGIVVTIEASKLPGAPKLTAVTGTTKDARMLPDKVTANQYWGLRAERKVGEGVFGVSYAQVQDHRTGFGVNASNLMVGPVRIDGEAVIGSTNTPGNFVAGEQGTLQSAFKNADKAAYIEARTDLGPVKFGANYRTIAPTFTNGNANARLSSADTRPYDADQVGYGVALGTDFGPVALGAYFDRYTKYDGKEPVQGFGVKAGSKFGAFEAVGFFNNLTVGGKASDGKAATINSGWLNSDYVKNDRGVVMGIGGVPFSMTSTFGAQVSHDGGSSNALVKNLNFTVGDAYYSVTKTNSLYAYGDYKTTLAGITVNPLFRYRMVSNGSAAYASEDYNFTTFKYGVKLSTEPFTVIPLQPSFVANVAGRNTTGKGSNLTTTELLAQAGLSFNRVLVDGLSAKVGYSMYTGSNVSPTNTANGDYDGWAFNPAVDPVYSVRAANGSSVNVNGVYAQLGWNGLTANYGYFRNKEGVYNDTTKKVEPQSSIAQAFRVSYNFKF